MPLYCVSGRRWLEFSLLPSGRAEVSFSGTESRNKGYKILNRILHLPLTSVFSGLLLRRALLVSCLRIETEEHWVPKLILLRAYYVLDIVRSSVLPPIGHPHFITEESLGLRDGNACSWSHSSWEAEPELEIKPSRLQSPCSSCHSMDSEAGNWKEWMPKFPSNCQVLCWQSLQLYSKLAQRQRLGNQGSGDPSSAGGFYNLLWLLKWNLK